MSKKYTIAYQHIGGERDKTTTSITQLFEYLEQALSEPHVVESSITINTEEKK